MKNFLLIVIVIIISAIVGYFVIDALTGKFTAENKQPSTTAETTEVDTVSEVATTTEELEEVDKTKTVLGQSVEGLDITAYHFGEGEREVMFIGGIHGGYSWNTALVAYELINYLKDNPTSIPSDLKVTVVPAMNPDGLSGVAGTHMEFKAGDVDATAAEKIAARFNANDVDLNRNFDCEWNPTGTWQNRSVSGGSAPFSEPESVAVRDYVMENEPDAVVVWYSAAGGVYTSNCRSGVLTDTKALTQAYAKAAGYKAAEEFNFYEITGDMVNWLAKSGIPAISVLLTNHEDTEWTKNLAGIQAIFEYLSE